MKSEDTRGLRMFDLTLTDTEGEELSLEDRGKLVSVGIFGSGIEVFLNKLQVRELINWLEFWHKENS